MAYRDRQLTFDDLRGLRAEGYIRDSTLDQKDGFGPAIQRGNEERFAEAYGLVLGRRWYTEFTSGRSVKKRLEFHRFLEDAGMDLFDVLLVDHTSRFGRNQAECIRYKEELRLLGKTVVFVSQGIISGSDRDFLAERHQRDPGRAVQPEPLPVRLRRSVRESGPWVGGGSTAVGLQERDHVWPQRGTEGPRPRRDGGPPFPPPGLLHRWLFLP